MLSWRRWGGAAHALDVAATTTTTTRALSPPLVSPAPSLPSLLHFSSALADLNRPQYFLPESALRPTRDCCEAKARIFGSRGEYLSNTRARDR